MHGMNYLDPRKKKSELTVQEIIHDLQNVASSLPDWSYVIIQL